VSNSAKKKMSESAKKRLIHGMTGKKHSQETKDKIRRTTLKQMNEGRMPHTNTRPHIAVKTYLLYQKIKFIEEYQIGVFSIDFFIPELSLAIEVQGDYWHSNPIFYPNGPETKGQKINYYRDKKKTKYLIDNDMKIFHIWEKEVNDLTYMNKIDKTIHILKEKKCLESTK